MDGGAWWATVHGSQRVGHDWATSLTHSLTHSLYHSSVGKEPACNAGDSGLILVLGKFAREGIGHPLQYSWASTVAQLIKNLPAMWETWVWSLGWEDSLEREKLSTLTFWPGEFLDCIGHRVAKSQTRLRDFHFHCVTEAFCFLINKRVAYTPYSNQSLACSIFFYFIPFRRCAVVSYCGFNVHFLIAYDIIFFLLWICHPFVLLQSTYLALASLRFSTDILCLRTNNMYSF